MKKINGRPLLLILMSFVIPCVVIAIALAGLGVTPFGDKTLVISDGDGLYINFLAYVGRAVKGQEGFLYSFEKSLGGNMMGSWGWFLLNPFFALFALFDITNYPLAFTLVSTMNLSLCGLTMYLLLADVYGHRLSHLIFSTAYALIGFNVANVFQMNFFTGVSALPIMALGLRRLLKGRNPAIYILALAYSLLTSFYFGFMLCAASLLLFLAYLITNWGELRDRRAVAARYGLSSLLAGALSCVVWLPALLSMRGGRLDQSVLHALTFADNMPVIDLFSKLFTGANTTDQLTNGLPNIFVGILPVALVILYLMNRDIPKKRRIAAAALLAVYLLSFYIVIFNLIMHGGTTTNWFNYRYSFVFSFLLLALAAEEWQRVFETPRASFRRTAAIMAVGALAVFSKQYPYVYGGEMLLDFAVLALMALAFFMHRRNPVKNTRRALEWVVLVLMCFNLYANYEISTKNIMEWGMSEQEYREVVAPVSAIVDAVRASDRDFYRMEIGEQRSETLGNDPMLYGYDGVGHGGSDGRDDERTALSALGIHRFDMRNYYGKGVPAATDALLGLRYVVSKEDLTEEKGYERLVALGEWALYKNEGALPVAMVADDGIDGTEIDMEDVFDNLNRTWTAISGEDAPVFVEAEDVVFTARNLFTDASIRGGDAQRIVSERDAQQERQADDGEAGAASDAQSQGAEKTPPENQSYIEYRWVADRDGAVYSYNRSGMAEEAGAMIPALAYEGYYRAGETVTGYLPVPNGFVTEYLLEEVAGRFRAAYADADALARLSEAVRSRPARIEKDAESRLHGAFTAGEHQELLFTIPYDEGWTLSIDGEATALKPALGAFMAADVGPGEHAFALRFVPAGLRAGAGVSAAALLALAAFLLADRRRRKRQRQNESTEPSP